MSPLKGPVMNPLLPPCPAPRSIAPASAPPYPSPDPSPQRRALVGGLLAGLLVACSEGDSAAAGTPPSGATPVPTPEPPAPVPVPVPAPTPPAPPPPPAAPRLYGVTIDDVTELPAIVDALQQLARRPTARIVFDENVPPADYLDAARAIHAVSGVMGEILDSYYVNTLSVAGYLARTSAYLDTLGEHVDLWEIGNEVNGEWLGDTADVVAKVAGAFDLVKARGRATALTLYYNQGCWSRADHEMFSWNETHLPARVRAGIDYALISYYEDDCNGLRPDWPSVFDRLGVLFPNARLGFGEVGTETTARKAEVLTRYYTLPIQHPRYIGGHFWWYFRQDMVPATQPLWRTLNDVFLATG